jgi:hypothetical protein|tara:strand:- start:39 stop:542 length:504 start_codon:yes stop_codon:yes gene_type:complete
MIIAKRPESSFQPAPEGLHHAVCCDVVDLGLVDTPWGMKQQVEVRWQLSETNPKTQSRYEVRKRYTTSLHEKANLRKDCESWRGKKFSDEELEGFDLEKLLDANAQVQVVHVLSDQGRTFDRVQAIVPNKKGPKLTVKDYVRQADRDETAGTQATPVVEVDLDEIPF